MADDRLAAATNRVGRLVDHIVALGAAPAEDDVRAAVDACLQRFNALDERDADAWILTSEREDIGQAIGKVIDLAGLEEGENWPCRAGSVRAARPRPD